MEKEEVDYYNENRGILYRVSTLCFCLKQYAKDYISEDRKNISNIDTKIRDDVLVDAINNLALQYHWNFGLRTEDLYDEQIYEKDVDPQCLLTTISNSFAYYLFNADIVESILNNKYTILFGEKIYPAYNAIILIDFFNYIAKINDYDREFTIVDLYEKAEAQRYNAETKQLKSFLELTSQYSEKLANGQNIDSIFNDMAEINNLKYISKEGLYYYTDETKRLVGQSVMRPWSKERVDEQIYAIAYAYAKMELPDKKAPQTEIIKEKIKEMSNN